MSEHRWLATIVPAAYSLAAAGTFVFLTFFDDYAYTWWNWIIVVPINGFLAGIWPVYWLIVRPLFG